MDGPPSLGDRIRTASRPLSPLPTPLVSQLEPIPDLRAVIFDLYGTLFISGSGDLAPRQPQHHEQALRGILARRGLGVPQDRQLTEEWIAVVRAEHRRAKQNGTLCPEVDVREIWGEVLREFSLSARDLEEIAIEWECVANPVWPMPGLRETLQTLRDRGFLLGIVSNAQFFTPLLFDALVGEDLRALGFEPDLCFWSYRERMAKPGLGLFERLVASLAHRGIRASQALYIGNDMRNDIAPAEAVGLNSALFAGDARSLRLRNQSPPLRRITSLGDLRRL